MPLRAQHRISGGEIVPRPGCLRITRAHRGLDIGGHIAARILEQRHEIVRGMPRKRILKVEQPQSLAVIDQHQILGMLIAQHRSEEHTSELQSLMRISYAVFCLKKKQIKNTIKTKSKDTQM